MQLGIYGAGGLGRGVLQTAKRMNKVHKLWDEIFFIDEFDYDREVHHTPVYSYNYCVKNYSAKNTKISIAVGEPSAKKSLYEKVKQSGYTLANVIDPDALIYPNVKHGDGLILKKGVIISSDCTIGENCCFESYSILSHDSVMGSNCQVSNFSIVLGNCSVGNTVFIGANSSIMQKLKIGDDCVISMGASVFKNVPSDYIAYGNPARLLTKSKDHKIFR